MSRGRRHGRQLSRAVANMPAVTLLLDRVLEAAALMRPRRQLTLATCKSASCGDWCCRSSTERLSRGRARCQTWSWPRCHRRGMPWHELRCFQTAYTRVNLSGLLVISRQFTPGDSFGFIGHCRTSTSVQDRRVVCPCTERFFGVSALITLEACVCTAVPLDRKRRSCYRCRSPQGPGLLHTRCRTAHSDASTSSARMIRCHTLAFNCRTARHWQGLHGHETCRAKAGVQKHIKRLRVIKQDEPQHPAVDCLTDACTCHTWTRFVLAPKPW